MADRAAALLSAGERQSPPQAGRGDAGGQIDACGWNNAQMKRKPLRPGEPPAYVNLRGEPIDLDALRWVLLDHARADDVLARQPAARPTAPPPRVALNADDIELVFDALCVAGCARGKTWLLHFLRGLERKSSRGAYFSAAELDAALQALRASGRIVDAGGTGFDLSPEARAARLPALLGRVAADETWKAWARAGATYGLHSPEPPEPSFRSLDEVVAFARLVLHAGLKLERFRIVAYRVMGPAADPGMLARALCQPFMPALLDSMDGALRDWLLDDFMGTVDLAEDSGFKRPFSFPMAPRTRHPPRVSRSSKGAESG